jgi:hypothetical protein
MSMRARVLPTPPLHLFPPADALAGKLYHLERKRFYESIDNASNGLIALMSTTVIAEVLVKTGFDPLVPAAVGALLAGLQLTYRYGTHVGTHAALARRYAEALRDMTDDDFNDPDVVQKWNKVLLVIAVDETPPMRAAWADAYDKAVRSYPISEAYAALMRKRLKWYHRRLRHWHPFSCADFSARQDENGRSATRVMVDTVPSPP